MARVANIKARNIVQLSHIRIFILTSKDQKTAKLHIRIRDNFIIKRAFSLSKTLSSRLNKIIHKRNIIKNEIKLIQLVIQGIQSDQFKELNIKTYQKIVNIIGMI